MSLLFEDSKRPGKQGKLQHIAITESSGSAEETGKQINGQWKVCDVFAEYSKFDSSYR